MRILLVATKGTSIAACTAQALGISRNQLPEKLRNSLNYYLKNSDIANMLQQQNNDIGSPHYQDRSISGSNKIFLRNLVLMDTLFDDKKKIVQWINGEPISNQELKIYVSQWQAKAYLYQALSNKKDDLAAFFNQPDINWQTDEIPYPYNDGHFSSIDLISQSIAADPKPSLYDQALKLVVDNQIGLLGELIEQHNDYFSLDPHCWLTDLYQAKLREHQELANLLP